MFPPRSVLDKDINDSLIFDKDNARVLFYDLTPTEKESQQIRQLRILVTTELNAKDLSLPDYWSDGDYMRFIYQMEGKVNKATVNEANNEANERKKVEDKVNKSTVKEANHEIHQIPKKINNSIKNAKISASNAAHEADLNKATAPPLKVINPSIPLKRAVQKEALLFNPLTMNNKYNKKGSFEYIYDKQNNPKILGAKIQAKLSGSNDPALIDPIHVNPMVVYDKNFEPLGKIVTKGMEHWTHFANPVATDSFLTNKGPKYPHQVNTIGKIVQGCHEEINQCIMHCRMTFSYNKVKGGP